MKKTIFMAAFAIMAMNSAMAVEPDLCSRTGDCIVRPKPGPAPAPSPTPTPTPTKPELYSDYFMSEEMMQEVVLTQ